MSNTTEGFSRQTAKQFTQFLPIAKGSAAELQSQLYITLNQGYIKEKKLIGVYLIKLDELARLISGFIQHLLSKGKQPKTLTSSVN